MDSDISEMMKKFSDMMGNSSSSNNQNSFPDFDINTMLKLKSVMDSMKNGNDSRSNLLRSLKPYLNESRKQKVDQYINLFNIEKIIQAFQEGGEKK